MEVLYINSLSTLFLRKESIELGIITCFIIIFLIVLGDVETVLKFVLIYFADLESS